jgi:NaMN:DMB phosphoribosyltransferase
VVSLKIPGLKSAQVAGSGPGGKVELSDIRAKLGEIRGEVDETAERAKPIAMYAAVGGVVLLVAAAFVLGRRRGRRKATWVEIRRL